MAETMRSPLATPKEVADYMHTTTAALAQSRYKGNGIPFVKPSPGRVLYRWSDVEKYIADRVMQRTDDRPGAA